MRTRNRRRLNAVLLTGGGLLAGVAGGFGAFVGGNEERVEQLFVRADLASDGTAQVREVIDYDFGAYAVDKHGIFRVVPDLPEKADIEVSSDTAPDDVEFIRQAVGTRIRIGDPNRTVNGRHRYEIDFPLPGVTDESAQVDWDAVGTEWEVPIEKAEIHLLAPFELTGMRCFVGGAGSTDTCDVRTVEPGHIEVTVDDLAKGEGVSLEGETGGPVNAPPREPSPPARPDDPSPGLLPPAAAAAVGALAVVGPTTWAVRRAGRERVAVGGEADAAFATGTPEGERRVDEAELAQMATTEFAPPEGLTPAQGGIVLKETVEPEHKVAWLIQEAIDGKLDLQEDDGRPVRLVRLDGADPEPAALGDMSARFRQQAFGSGREIDLGEYDADFASAWRGVDHGLDNWRLTSGFWEHRSDDRRVFGLVLGIGGAILGAIAAAVGGVAVARAGVGWLPLAGVGGVLAGIGLAAAIGSWELRVRTPAGTAAWLRVESFRRFLAESEAYHAEEAAKRGVLREYTAWAVAVGEIDRWSRAVRSATAIPDGAGLSYVYMAPLLFSSTSSSATAPSSSGSGGFSGGFGGGSVGGGAGGGGGGSW